MRRAAILSFTEKGTGLNLWIGEQIRRESPGMTIENYAVSRFAAGECRPFTSITELMCDLFPSMDGILFIGAMGIAVRSIAPLIAGKDCDPAVLVMDELGEYCVSVLSGHLGGANEWCREVAVCAGAQPVITTATDCEQRFAVDVFAAKNFLSITEIGKIKEISGRILEGKKVGAASEEEISGPVPDGLRYYPISSPEGAVISDELYHPGSTGTAEEAGFYIGYDKTALPFQTTLHLIPRDLFVGMGCRKGTPFTQLADFLDRAFRERGMAAERIRAIYSIDRKKEEEGLIQLARKLRVPFVTFSEDALRKVEGEYQGSAFVEHTVGVDNVCERSAVLGSGGGVLLVPKQAENGMTFAVAQKKFRLRWTWQTPAPLDMADWE
ncbi:cobalt-precorrin 5A hydrolase [Diplocloster modestus]|uniref:Cobalt-precorrin 5A hydrolase n=1 Tax=Diplocloster modestus TaxID=2850322 RepID=A0ABS6K697_9FIRM|nr:cobalt-precorrin 5A hydrolase [Diplocloster modestus]MBU9726061.1 cobalt-precorrin 5A hydrolase [Diplocloster modestus]